MPAAGKTCHLPVTGIQSDAPAGALNIVAVVIRFARRYMPALVLGSGPANAFLSTI
jgi:hypothetical protein